MDFAKLFRVDGIGQVLAEVEEHPEHEVPCVRFRIPDAGDVFLEMRLSTVTDDYDKAESIAREIFGALTEDNIGATVKDLVAARDNLLPAIQQNKE